LVHLLVGKPAKQVNTVLLFHASHDIIGAFILHQKSEQYPKQNQHNRLLRQCT